MEEVARFSGGRSCSLYWVMMVLAACIVVGSTGCGPTTGPETGYADQSRTQLQFYSPPGAMVTVKGGNLRSHQIAEVGPYNHRLEYSPEEFSVFNLKPGNYEFKYTTAAGLPGVSVYGELDVKSAGSKEARIFRDRAFIPIALPSTYYEQVSMTGDEIFPYRGEAFRRAIDELDLQRLKQGDVVEKVVFVADLEKASAVKDLTEQDIAVLEREIEYADARFRDAYLDSKVEVTDFWSNLTGSDRKHIKWERRRIELQQELAAKEALLDRVNALLRFDHVLTRKGMLVVATEEVVATHMDPEEAAEELGEVLLVLRIGGRHMHWGDPSVERASYDSNGE